MLTCRRMNSVATESSAGRTRDSKPRGQFAGPCMHPVRASVAARPSPYLRERGILWFMQVSQDRERSRGSKFGRKLEVKN